MSYVILSHVATGDLATASLHNILLDDLAIQKTSINDDGTLKISYPSSIASVTSTSETDVVTWTIPANAMADGDLLLIVLTVQLRNSTGGAATPTFKFKWGATSITLNSTAWSSIASTRTHMFVLLAQRAGSDLVVLDPPAASSVALITIAFDLVAAAEAPTGQVMSAPTFSSSQTVKLTVTLPSYNAANHFWNTLAARVFRLGN